MFNSITKNLNNKLKIIRYYGNLNYFHDYDKMIYNMKILHNRIDECLKTKYIFTYQQKMEPPLKILMEQRKGNIKSLPIDKSIIDKYTLTIIHKNDINYINYNNKINHINIHNDFNKMLSIMKNQKLIFYHKKNIEYYLSQNKSNFINNYFLNNKNDYFYDNKISFINLIYNNIIHKNNEESNIFMRGRLINKKKSLDNYNIIITNEFKIIPYINSTIINNTPINNTPINPQIHDDDDMI